MIMWYSLFKADCVYYSRTNCHLSKKLLRLNFISILSFEPKYIANLKTLNELHAINEELLPY